MARGPAYPYIGLEKAVATLGDVFDYAKKAAVDADSLIRDKLKMSPKSSSAGKILAALKYFGLIEFVSRGKNRELKVTERGMQILFGDKASEEYKTALREAVLEPAQYRYCWETFGAEPPDTAAIRSHLVVKRDFVPNTVDGFLEDYFASIEYAGLLSGKDLDSDRDSVKSPNREGAEAPKNEPDPPASIEIGDYIQWESQGVWQFPSPRRVASISPDGAYLFVDGGGTGIPVGEAKKAAPPPPPPSPRDPGVARHDRGGTPMGVQQATIPLPEGDAALQWPKAMSAESFEDFEAWVQLMLRRAKRSVVEGVGRKNGDGGEQD